MAGSVDQDHADDADRPADQLDRARYLTQPDERHRYQREQEQHAGPRASAGFVPHVVARATDFNVLLQLVAAGAGVALVPHLATQHLPPPVRLLLPAVPITRQVFIVGRRGGLRKSSVRGVLDALTEAAKLVIDL